MKYIKSIKEFFNAEPAVKPAEPIIKPSKPSPIPTKRPSIAPKPKASIDMVVKRFLELKRKMNEAELRDADLFSDYDKWENDEFSKKKSEIDSKLRDKNIVPHQFMMFLQQAMKIQKGKESELESIAYDAIEQYYGSILDNVDLDLRISSQSEINDIFNSGAQKFEEDEDTEDEKSLNIPSSKFSESGDIKLTEIEFHNLMDEVNKRKVINNIIQGSGIAVHEMLHLPEIKERLESIHPELFDLYDKMIKTNDWHIFNLSKEQLSGSGVKCGVNKVEWSDIDEDTKEDAQDFLERIEDGDMDISDSDEIFNEGSPKIIARSLDFIVLLHETVKGIYELIASAGIPQNPELASQVLSKTDTTSDEMDDFKTGQIIKAKMLDFISNLDSFDETIPNINEFIFGRLVTMEAKQFLNIMKGILNNLDYAKVAITSIIKEIQSEHKQYNTETMFGNGSEDNNIPTNTQSNMDGEDDYSKLSKNQINDLVNKALDNEDYDTLNKLKPFVKESKKFKK